MVDVVQVVLVVIDEKVGVASSVEQGCLARIIDGTEVQAANRHDQHQERHRHQHSPIVSYCNSADR